MGKVWTDEIVIEAAQEVNDEPEPSIPEKL
jgi:hypothetical protein